MKKIPMIAMLVLGAGAVVLAVLAILHCLSWTYAILAFVLTAAVATGRLLWQFHLLRGKNDKTVRSKDGL